MDHKLSHRIGIQIWWISDVRRFQAHYPTWQYQYGLSETLVEFYQELIQRNLTDEK